MKILITLIVIFCSIITSTVKAVEVKVGNSINNLTEQDKKLLIANNFWNNTCPVKLDRLKMVTFTHYTFDGAKQQGEIIVLDILAPYVLKIFKELEKAKFPINSANKFQQEFEQKNNTTAFICRKIQNSKALSLHSYGAAIDINPLQNPFVTLNKATQTNTDNIPEVLVSIQPVAGQNYLNRYNLRAGMAEPITHIFKNNGFTRWGGVWNSPIDWQHFEVPRELITLLLVMQPEDAKYLLYLYVNSEIVQKDITIINKELSLAYKNNPTLVMETIKNNEENFLNNPLLILALLN